MNIGERIATARKSKGISQAKLAELVGVTRGSCGHWEQGVTVPSVDNLSRLAITLDVSFEWLATGRGSQVLSKTGLKPKVDYGPAEGYLPTDIQNLIRHYKQLDSAGKDLLINLLRRIGKNNL